MIGESKPEVFSLACYLAELCLVEIKINKWLPSRVATSCIYLSRKMHKNVLVWSNETQAVTQLSEKQVRESARDICSLIDVAHSKKVFEPIFKKYMTSKHHYVA